MKARHTNEYAEMLREEDATGNATGKCEPYAQSRWEIVLFPASGCLSVADAVLCYYAASGCDCGVWRRIERPVDAFDYFAVSELVQLGGYVAY